MLSQERPSRPGAPLGEGPWQLPVGPIQCCFPSLPLRWGPGFFASSPKTAAGPGKKARETWALTREGSQGQNQVLKKGKPASTSPFQLMKVLGFCERKNVFTLFHKLDSSPHPPSTPSKLVLLFVQVERPGSYRNPTSSPRAPARGWSSVLSSFFMEMYGLESLVLFHKESVSVWRWI